MWSFRRNRKMLLDFVSCLNERPEWWAQVNAQHESTIYLEQTLKSIIVALRNLLDTYREVAKVERLFRLEISKLNEVLPQEGVKNHWKFGIRPR